jgi:hypothetical protein
MDTTLGIDDSLLHACKELVRLVHLIQGKLLPEETRDGLLDLEEYRKIIAHVKPLLEMDDNESITDYTPNPSDPACKLRDVYTRIISALNTTLMPVLDLWASQYDVTTFKNWLNNQSVENQNLINLSVRMLTNFYDYARTFKNNYVPGNVLTDERIRLNKRKIDDFVDFCLNNLSPGKYITSRASPFLLDARGAFSLSKFAPDTWLIHGDANNNDVLWTPTLGYTYYVCGLTANLEWNIVGGANVAVAANVWVIRTGAANQTLICNANGQIKVLVRVLPLRTRGIPATTLIRQTDAAAPANVDITDRLRAAEHIRERFGDISELITRYDEYKVSRNRQAYTLRALLTPLHADFATVYGLEHPDSWPLGLLPIQTVAGGASAATRLDQFLRVIVRYFFQMSNDVAFFSDPAFW